MGARRQDPGQKPFTYNAGVQQVITGWDQGCLGMAVGEVRKLDIPAVEGYGASGMPLALRLTPAARARTLSAVLLDCAAYLRACGWLAWCSCSRRRTRISCRSRTPQAFRPGEFLRTGAFCSRSRSLALMAKSKQYETTQREEGQLGASVSWWMSWRGVEVLEKVPQIRARHRKEQRLRPHDLQEAHGLWPRILLEMFGTIRWRRRHSQSRK